MIIAKTVKEFNLIRKNIKKQKKIGFIPTMGSLHDGHISLINKAKTENDITIVSIFINPTQFNNKYDYKTYPNNLKNDIKILKLLNVNILFNPNKKDMYPNGNLFEIIPKFKIANILEGKSRPKHFSGMLTIILKLIEIIKAHNLYLGEKDYQQMILIKKFIKNFFININVINCPIKRKSFGLPYSSRNKNLSTKDIETAKLIYEILKQDDFSNIKNVFNKIQNLGIKIEYIYEINNRIFLAFYIGNVRLIDNFLKKIGP